MGYLHLPNLYKDQDILLFKEVYALEKVHGTSAHVTFKSRATCECCHGQGEHLQNKDTGADVCCACSCQDYKAGPRKVTATFFSGGASHERFKGLFNEADLIAKIEPFARETVTIYGEAYGGGGVSGQGMSGTYGKELRFIVFDVQFDDLWLSVPDMTDVATGLGLEVVPWEKIPATLEAINAVRDKPSEVAARRGCGTDKPREGVVLRPLIELRKNNDERIICKHRIEKYSERATPQKIIDPAQLKVLEDAKAIAEEWVVPNRLIHVLQKLPHVTSTSQTKEVIDAMIEDVYREAKGEIVEGKAVEAAIGKRTAVLLKAHFSKGVA